MKLSVAMVTYNGETYVRDQIVSIGAQTRMPDELVVSDDGSTDATVAIIERMAETLPFPVYVHRQAHVGPAKNVERAIRECSGDLIALADQDDVWHREKLAVSEQALVGAPNAGLVFGDAEVVDDRLSPLGFTLLQSVYFGSRERRVLREGRAFEILLRRDMVQGATIVLRSHLRDLLLPIPLGGVRMPDAWIALVASAVSDIVYVDRSLLLYRQHSGQWLGAKRPTRFRMLAKRFLGQVEWKQIHGRLSPTEWEQLFSRLEGASARNPRAENATRFAHLDARHHSVRAGLPSTLRNRAPWVLKEVLAGSYRRHSSGLVSATRDLVRSPQA